MKIAVVGPSPIPFVYGGAEKLMFELCENINTYTNHQAELIKVPIKETDFWSLIEAYYTFYKMDLSQFDMIITSKYPSWMVQHSNSVCWLMHTLRGLYDTYGLILKGTEVERENIYINEILDYMETGDTVDNLDVFFDMLFSLRQNKSGELEKYFEFPGAFIRRIIHYLDNFGLKRQQRLFSISNTVKKREDYFPQGYRVNTVYPPIVCDDFKCGKSEYFFVCSRLDAPKRLDILIEQYKKCKTDKKLKIAGMGPQYDNLLELAKDDERIELLGFVSDEEKGQLYENAIAVPFIPYDEDYGYITIEAMMHKKPVVTLTDSGGSVEFVKDGKTGFVVEQNEISEKLDFYADNIQIAKLHGANAYRQVKDISWQRCVHMLVNHECDVFDDTEIEKKETKRKKIVVTSTFSVYPPLGGGQARIYNLYKNLASSFDVEIIASDSCNSKDEKIQLAPGLVENRIPRTIEHEHASDLMAIEAGIPVTDIAMLTLSGLTPRYGEELKKAIRNSALIIVSHPYMYPELKKYLQPDQKIVYEAHNVEYKIKRDMLSDSDMSKKLLEQIYDVEKELCEKAEFIMTCSEEDISTLESLYGADRKKMIVVPNGVDCSKTEYTSLSHRLQNKKRYGLENEKIGIFMGSWHKPNLEACLEIFRIAEECPETKFFLLGSQCKWVERENIKMPYNVGLLGLVSEKEKNRIFSIADFALNPMMSGSGTNLKMFDYLAAGVPVISTEFGTRGIENKEIFQIYEVDEMETAVKKFNLRNESKIIENGRKYMEQVFDWSVIADKLKTKIIHTVAR